MLSIHHPGPPDRDHDFPLRPRRLARPAIAFRDDRRRHGAHDNRRSARRLELEDPFT
jgi:hypothetical protein